MIAIIIIISIIVTDNHYSGTKLITELNNNYNFYNTISVLFLYDKITIIKMKE